MKIIKVIKDKDIPPDDSTMKIRESSRGVFFDENRAIPLLFASNCDIHELPGGGIEPGEDKLSALAREVLEESGSEIEVAGELGTIIEYRSKMNTKQISYCYIGKIISKGSPQFTEEELHDGTILEWVTIDDAISKVESDNSNEYEGSFIQERDLLLLKLAKQKMSAN